MHELPLKFNRINGDFQCQMNGLTSLHGAPQHVSGDFKCYGMHLSSLEGGPKYVGGYYDCHNNRLTSLVGAPTHVGGDFNASMNRLSNLNGAPGSIGGDLNIQDNQLQSLYSGVEDIELKGSMYISYNPLLPKEIILAIKYYRDSGQNINEYHITILKYQRHFFIWNDDLTLNVKNFKDLMREIKEGLL